MLRALQEPRWCKGRAILLDHHRWGCAGEHAASGEAEEETLADVSSMSLESFDGGRMPIKYIGALTEKDPDKVERTLARQRANDSKPFFTADDFLDSESSGSESDGGDSRCKSNNTSDSGPV